jgi:hypothetical protein
MPSERLGSDSADDTDTEQKAPPPQWWRNQARKSLQSDSMEERRARTATAEQKMAAAHRMRRGSAGEVGERGRGREGEREAEGERERVKGREGQLLALRPLPIGACDLSAPVCDVPSFDSLSGCGAV